MDDDGIVDDGDDVRDEDEDFGSCVALALVDNKVAGLSSHLTVAGCLEKVTVWSTKWKEIMPVSVVVKKAKASERPKTIATTICRKEMSGSIVALIPRAKWCGLRLGL